MYCGGVAVLIRSFEDIIIVISFLDNKTLHFSKKSHVLPYVNTHHLVNWQPYE
jgi:hypothetical protein